MLKFELYVGESYAHNVTDFGKTHDLVLRMMDGYLGKSFILYMDNWYTSPYLYYNLLLSKTGACGTSRPRKGLPPGLLDAKLKTKGEQKVCTYDDKMVAMRYALILTGQVPMDVYYTHREYGPLTLRVPYLQVIHAGQTIKYFSTSTARCDHPLF